VQERTEVYIFLNCFKENRIKLYLSLNNFGIILTADAFKEREFVFQTLYDEFL